MAKRRMFNLDIVDDDVFLSMPISAQSLYFHLGMRADDDGFVTPLKVMRMIGANQDDLSILIAKRYVLHFDSGVVVIKHWPIQNTIRKDRYIATTYRKEFEQLTLNEWGVYTEKRKINSKKNDVESITTINTYEDTENNENGNHLAPQYSIGKVSIGKNSNTTNVVLVDEQPEKKVKKSSKEINEIFEYWEEIVGQKINSNIKSNRFAASNLLKKFGEAKLKQLIVGVSKSHFDRYAPRISDFRSLQSKVDELITWGRRTAVDRKSKTGVVL